MRAALTKRRPGFCRILRRSHPVLQAKSGNHHRPEGLLLGTLTEEVIGLVLVRWDTFPG